MYVHFDKRQVRAVVVVSTAKATPTMSNQSPWALTDEDMKEIPSLLGHPDSQKKAYETVMVYMMLLVGRLLQVAGMIVMLTYVHLVLSVWDPLCRTM
jgi:hypothetical protein